MPPTHSPTNSTSSPSVRDVPAARPLVAVFNNARHVRQNRRPVWHANLCSTSSKTRRRRRRSRGRRKWRRLRTTEPTGPRTTARRKICANLGGGGGCDGFGDGLPTVSAPSAPPANAPSSPERRNNTHEHEIPQHHNRRHQRTQPQPANASSGDNIQLGGTSPQSAFAVNPFAAIARSNSPQKSSLVHVQSCEKV